MDIETAIKTAIEFEIRVREAYVEAFDETKDPIGKKVFGLLADEEDRHVKYLEHQLRKWKETGKLTLENLETALPNLEEIDREAAKLEAKLSPQDRNQEISMLEKAQEVEIETTTYYKKLVSELTDEGKALFKRFVEIEEGHLALAQAELDSLTGTGYWFDMMEFDVGYRY
jgi:rubrerythrin